MIVCLQLSSVIVIVVIAWQSEMKRKTSFPFAFHSFFRNFAGKTKRMEV